eukprot:309680_1
MARTSYFFLWYLLIVIHGNHILPSIESSGHFPASFDCPMRQLVLEYAQHIQPHLAKNKLQEIADALNGDPLKPQNCTISPNNLPYPPASTNSKP